jgi:hypothetical protein
MDPVKSVVYSAGLLIAKIYGQPSSQATVPLQTISYDQTHAKGRVLCRRGEEQRRLLG